MKIHVEKYSWPGVIFADIHTDINAGIIALQHFSANFCFCIFSILTSKK